MTARLKVFGQVLPSSSGDLELLRVVLAQQASEHADDLGQLSQDHEKKVGEKMRLAAANLQLKAELDRVSKRRGNIPHDADQRRRLIANGVRIRSSVSITSGNCWTRRAPRVGAGHLDDHPAPGQRSAGDRRGLPGSASLGQQP